MIVKIKNGNFEQVIDNVRYASAERDYINIKNGNFEQVIDNVRYASAERDYINAEDTGKLETYLVDQDTINHARNTGNSIALVRINVEGKDHETLLSCSLIGISVDVFLMTDDGKTINRW